jgi:Dehydrogenases with different specificities (related to short-chain alcohol dehydrogenases)
MTHDQRQVVITGGASGIGYACAELFAARGDRVVIVDIRGEASEAAAARIGPAHRGLACDVTDEGVVTRLFAELGRCDVLVNNAGVGDSALPTLEQSAAQFRRMLDINLTGAFLMAREAARVMPQGGAIVSLASIAALSGLAKRNGYGAAKAGIVALTRNLACEWAARGIRVNAVAPGYVETELVRGLERDGLFDTGAIRKRCPMGRLIQPAEVAEAIYFLASPMASAITGTTLSVDAGWMAYGAAGDAWVSEEATG